MRKLIAGVALGAALVFSGSTMALADDVVESPAPLQTSDYTPDEPITPSIAGSTAIGDCERDVPWISYSLELTDPDNVSTDKTATLFMTNGTDSLEIPLGTLQNNRLSGRILWPGASVDASGVANGWPGWAQNASGAWVETDGNYRWTRGDITSEIRVNPNLAVALSYPQATPECLSGPRSSAQTAGFLPATGLSAAVLPLSIAGGVIVLAGVSFLVVQRRRRSRA
ncbi:LPXTG cell wall anchor domain-containing protein [Microbacterium sp. SLBN-146]|uniref:LPXTG cell wall anchor domain-containing protein n=1 Tax=Microbacterium sp. SLBN-146 TaxID=2768457 RepID=UPI00116F82ED|nr:LPXTG cell wall anchor domain-containing protein [Microbacterium sp. SLBN-146]TQJ32109.1 LPXTG-motif cell wall-anchored protein [Microbacterium sp. SLBN-146]